MVSNFRIAILLLLAIVIQSSLQNKTNRSVNNNKDESTSNLVERSLNNSKNNDYVSKNDHGVSNKKKKKSIKKGTTVVGGGNGLKCYTKNELRTKRIRYAGHYFSINYYVTVRVCTKF